MKKKKYDEPISRKDFSDLLQSVRKCSRCGKIEDETEDISRVSACGWYPFNVRLCRNCTKKLIMFFMEEEKDGK